MFKTNVDRHASRDARQAPSIFRTRIVVHAFFIALFVFLAARSAQAYPNMIRLGYTSCATCHVSPQGGGVLTRYGRGIDYAQTIRAGEPPDAELPSDAISRFLYDARLQMQVDHPQSGDDEYSFNSTFRTAVALNRDNRVV